MAFASGIADFRSDTVTQPTPDMRRAMAEAEVGDDVYGEDPTVNRLQEESAVLLGAEASVFVPSGLMANEIAINLHTRPGDEVACNEWGHVRNFEMGSASSLSGVAFRSVGSQHGLILANEIVELVGAIPTHPSRVSLLVWENTYNGAGGTVIPHETMERTSEIARQHKLAVHLDGARIWNAVAASGVAASRYAACADTTMFCVSKGLGAPVGSLLAGRAHLIEEAKLRRRRFGGGMRQAGVLAAAGLVALRDRERLVEDHQLARRLAEELADRFPKAIDLDQVQTNMVLVDQLGLPISADQLMAALAGVGVKVGLIRRGVLRFVTHRDVDGADVSRVLSMADQVAAGRL